MENKLEDNRGTLNFKDVYVNLFYSINRNTLKFESVYSPATKLSEVVNHYLMDMEYFTRKCINFPGILYKKKIEQLKLELTRKTIGILIDKYYENTLFNYRRDYYPNLSLLEDIDEFTYDSIMSNIDTEIRYIDHYTDHYLSKIESLVYSVNDKSVKNLFNFVKDTYNVSFSSKEDNDRMYRLLEKLDSFLSVYYYYTRIEQLTKEIRRKESDDTVFKYHEDVNELKREWSIIVDKAPYTINTEEHSRINDNFINIFTKAEIYSTKTANLKFSKTFLDGLSKDIFNDKKVRGYLEKSIKNISITQENKSIKISFSLVVPFNKIEKFTGLKYDGVLDGVRIHRALSDLIITQLIHILSFKIDKYEPDKTNDKDNIKDKLVTLSEELQSLIEEIE